MYGAKNGGKYFCWRDGEIVPRRKSDKFVDSEPIVIENKFEAIIDQETYGNLCPLTAMPVSSSRSSKP